MSRHLPVGVNLQGCTERSPGWVQMIDGYVWIESFILIRGEERPVSSYATLLDPPRLLPPHLNPPPHLRVPVRCLVFRTSREVAPIS